MKGCVVLVFVALAACVVTEENRQYISDISKRCDAKFGSIDAHSAKDNIEKIYCSQACKLKAMGTMNPDNTINIKKIEEVLEPIKKQRPESYHKIMKIHHECHAFAKPEADECAAVKHFYQCFYNTYYSMVKITPSSSHVNRTT